MQQAYFPILLTFMLTCSWVGAPPVNPVLNGSYLKWLLITWHPFQQHWSPILLWDGAVVSSSACHSCCMLIPGFLIFNSSSHFLFAHKTLLKFGNLTGSQSNKSLGVSVSWNYSLEADFTVPATPSHALFPRLVAKNFHSASMPKSPKSYMQFPAT